MAQHGKLTGLMTPLEKVVRVANSAAETAHRAETRKAGSIYVPNSDGTWTVIGEAAGDDETGNPQAIKTFVGDETPPSAPVGVSWESSYGDITAVWGGKLTDGTPADFDHVEFRALADNQTTLIGRLKRPGSVSAYLTEGQTYSCVAVAVDVQGNDSDATAAVDVTCVNTFTDVREDVDKAQQAASDAAQAAAKAEATVDGKNSVFASADAPTAKAQGDLWFVLDASGDVTGVKIWNGTAWADYQLVADSVVVPSSIGDTLIADGAITTEKIYAGAVTADKISVEDLSALRATIGGTTIDTDSVHTVGKTGIDDDTPGLYLDSDGQLALGDGNSSIKFYRAENPDVIDVAEDGGWKLDIDFDNDFATHDEVSSAIKASADGLTVSIKTVQTTADDAATAASSAQSTADSAKSAADTAQDTADNALSTAETANTSASTANSRAQTIETLIRQSGEGVEVARKVDGEYTSTKTLMDDTGFRVVASDGTELSSFEADSIELAKTTTGAEIKMAGGRFSIKGSDTGGEYLVNWPGTEVHDLDGSTKHTIPYTGVKAQVTDDTADGGGFMNAVGIAAMQPEYNEDYSQPLLDSALPNAYVTAAAYTNTGSAYGQVEIHGDKLYLDTDAKASGHQFDTLELSRKLQALLECNVGDKWVEMASGTAIVKVTGAYGSCTLLPASTVTSLIGHTAAGGNTAAFCCNGDTSTGAWYFGTRFENGALNIRTMSTDSTGAYASVGTTLRVNYLLVSFAG